MKSYTDLEQSKKLAKILSLKSADMCYKCLDEDPYDIVCKPYSEWKEEYKGLVINGDADVIPCWSLAALLSVLPDEITDDGDVYRNMLFHLKGKYIIQYPRLTTLWPSLLSVDAGNPVDAAYKMILELNGLKML